VAKSDNKDAAEPADVAPSNTAVQSAAVSLKLLLAAALLCMNSCQVELFALHCMLPQLHAENAGGCCCRTPKQKLSQTP
jgi:hypothetical protein